MVSTGDLIGPLEIGPVAHGGLFVAHHDGRVVFVRHTAPGEVVMARVTQVNSRMLRADAVRIERASPDRATPACPIAGPGLCGGCDFQHLALGAQRSLKAVVLADQLRRLAGIDWEGEVEEVPGDRDGFGWRTRVRYLRHGRTLGMRAHRSHRFVPLPDAGCLLAVPSLRRPPVSALRPVGRRIRGVQEVAAAVDGEDRPLRDEMPVTVSVRGVPGAFHLTADSFWQVHPGAADALVEAVLDGVGVHAGESVLDLYCGAGLFAGALAARGATVTGVEANTSAVDLARRNVPGGRFIAGDVSRCLPGLGEADVVVLDPPRAGAGRDVMRAVLNAAPRVIAYVACDPAALARDLSETTGRYEPVSIRAFDLFPQTHHFECVALLTKSGSDPTDASRPRAL